MAALGFALLEFFQMLSRRRLSSGDSVRCSVLGREPLLRSLLKLKPRERGRCLGEVALCSIIAGGGDYTAAAGGLTAPIDLGPPLGSARLVLTKERLAGEGGRRGGR